MDNASKALLIAGEMLISILIIGLIASAISKFGGFSQNINKQLNESKLEDFNGHFLLFESKIDTTAEEIVSLANYAKENNDKYELFLKNGYDSNKNSPYFVEVIVKGLDNSGYQYQFNQCSSDIEYKSKIKRFLEQYNQNLFRCKWKIVSIKNSVLKTGDDSGSKNNLSIISEDNGRKGYVKSITFELTKINNNEYLTKVNRDDYTIE